jgi:HDOD domain
MSIGSKQHPPKTASDSNAKNHQENVAASVHSLARSARQAPDLAQRLDRLLDASPADLERISVEIRNHPELVAMMMRLTASLAPETIPCSLEDAVVVLGTHRLRVLVYMWSVLPHAYKMVELAAQEANSEAGAGDESVRAGASAQWTLEAMYLASFLRWLGLDNPGNANASHIAPYLASAITGRELAALHELLMQDFISLIPVLDPALLRPR